MVEVIININLVNNLRNIIKKKVLNNQTDQSQEKVEFSPENQNKINKMFCNKSMIFLVYF